MAYRKKLSHRRLTAWIATAAPTAVGSGGWLGFRVILFVHIKGHNQRNNRNTQRTDHCRSNHLNAGQNIWAMLNAPNIINAQANRNNAEHDRDDAGLPT